MYTPPDPYADQTRKQRNLVVWASVGAVVLLLVGVGIGMLAAQKPAEPSVLSKVAKTPPPVLAAKAPEPTPALQSEGMPKDVIDWLNHLKATHDKFSETSKGQLMPMLKMGAMAGTLGGLTPEQAMAPEGPDVEHPGKGFQDLTVKMTKENQAVLDFYHSKPPPPECSAIATSFESYLSEENQMMLEVAKMFTDLGSNPNASDELGKMLGAGNRKRIDDMGALANSQIQELCDRYHAVNLWKFDVDPTSGAAPILSGIKPPGL